MLGFRVMDPPHLTKRPHPRGTDPQAEPIYVSDRARHGLSFEGLYFSVRSRVRELWTKQVLDQYIKYRRVQRNRRARACAAGPPRARTPPHMTSEVMLSACTAFIHAWGTAFICVCTAFAPHLHRVCDVIL